MRSLKKNLPQLVNLGLPKGVIVKLLLTLEIFLI